MVMFWACCLDQNGSSGSYLLPAGSAGSSLGSSLVQQPAGDAPAALHLNPTPELLGLGPVFPTIPRVGEPYRKETWLEGAGKTFTVSIPWQLRPCPKVTRI